MEWSVQIPENKLGINVTSKIISIGNKTYSFDYDDSTLAEDAFAFRVHFFDYEKNKWCKLRYYDEQNYYDVPRAGSRGFNIVSWDKYAYMWGGYNVFQFADFGDYFDTLYRFNSETGVWDRPEVFGVIPEGKEYHISAVVNGKMYLIGANYEEPMEFYCLDLETHIWTFIENEHPHYYNSSSDCFVAKNRCIYFSAGGEDMFNGTARGAWTQYFGCFDTKTHSLTYETASTNDLNGRYISKGFSHNDLIYIFVGSRRDFFFTRYLFKYNNVSKDLKKIQVPSKKLHIRGIVQKGLKAHFFVEGKVPKKLLGKEELAKLSPDQKNEGDFVLTLDLAFDLKSLCIEKVASYKLDISELPKVLQKEIEEF